MEVFCRIGLVKKNDWKVAWASVPGFTSPIPGMSGKTDYITASKGASFEGGLSAESMFKVQHFSLSLSRDVGQGAKQGSGQKDKYHVEGGTIMLPSDVRKAMLVNLAKLSEMDDAAGLMTRIEIHAFIKANQEEKGQSKEKMQNCISICVPGANVLMGHCMDTDPESEDLISLSFAGGTRCEVAHFDLDIVSSIDTEDSSQTG